MEVNTKEILGVLKRNVVPALGCTEPIAVALACAKAAEALGEKPSQIRITLDKNIMRNAFAVGIPGTGERGVKIAAALGAFAGNADKSLMVIEGIDEKYIERAKFFIKKNGVEVNIKEDTTGIYILSEMSTDKHKASALIKGSHGHIERVLLDGKVIYENTEMVGAGEGWFEIFKELDISSGVKLAESLPLEEIDFVEEGLKLNVKAADVGLMKKAGLGYGSDLFGLIGEGFSIQNVIARSKVEAAAASDARMAGLPVPVMSSFGSGNQGIVINASISAVAREMEFLVPDWLLLEAEKRDLDSDSDGDIVIEKYKMLVIRSLALAHLICGITKTYTGILSPYCEAAITTAGAASAGCVYLLGGDLEQMENAFQLTVAATEGVFCDGAKESCALKTAMGAGTAVENAYLSMKGSRAPKGMGIVGNNFKETLLNLERLSNEIRSNDVVMKLLVERNTIFKKGELS